MASVDTNADRRASSLNQLLVKNCDERVCISIHSHISKITLPNFTKFSVTVNCATAQSSSGGIAIYYVCWFFQMSYPTRQTCKILVKIGPVVSVENRLTDGNCAARSRHGSTANNTSCSSYCKVHDIMRPVSDHLMYVPLARLARSICQGTLPWQPNDVG